MCDEYEHEEDYMQKRALKTARDAGFVMGIAWAVALLAKHPHSAETLLQESGLTFMDFKKAGTDDHDLKVVRKVFADSDLDA